MGCGDAVRVAAFPIFTSVRLRPRPDRHSHGRPASLLLWALRDPPAPLLLSQDRPELRHLCVLGCLVSLELRRDLLPPRLLSIFHLLPLLFFSNPPHYLHKAIHQIHSNVHQYYHLFFPGQSSIFHLLIYLLY